MTTPDQLADDARDAALRINSDNATTSKAMRAKATSLRFTADTILTHAAELETAADLHDQRTTISVADLNDTIERIRDL
jgi:hypothetical protein